MFRSGEKSATGIHLEGRSLRLAVLARQRGRTAVRALIEEVLPVPFAPRELAGAEGRSVLAEALQRLAEEHGLAMSRPCIGLDRRVVWLKRRPLLPGADERANREQLLWEAGQFLGAEDGEFSVDCILGPRWGFVVAVRRRVLDFYLELAAGAGLEDVEVDVEPFALYNAGEGGGLVPGGGAELLVHAGDGGASLLLVAEGEILETGTCAWETERAMLDQLEARARSAVEDAGLEGSLQRLWLAGAGAGAWGAELAGRLEVDSDVLDPFSDMEAEALAEGGAARAEQAPAFAVAAGLAQRRLCA